MNNYTGKILLERRALVKSDEKNCFFFNMVQRFLP